MSVHLHIDRLVVTAEGITADLGALDRLGADVETELRRRFTTDGHGGRVSPSTRRDTVRARRRDTVRSDTAEPGSPLAGAIAASVHSAVAGAR